MGHSCPDNPGRGVWSAFAAMACAFAQSAVAGPSQPPPDYGFQWATIAHPGNAPWVGYAANEGPPSPTIAWGDVAYQYRIAKTEVSNGQWLDFVRAAAPFVPANDRRGRAFTGEGIVAVGNQFIPVESADWAVRAGWRYAAWYANWSHNGQKPAGVATAADFASGAYDISTFNSTGQIGITDQATRSEGAKYWVPSIDEWVKAVYWDPNRNGAGQPGYWLYPGSQDTPLITAPSSSGGQTDLSAGPMGQAYSLLIGQYANVTGPWGLLDASGNASEWLEDKGGLNRRIVDSHPLVPLFLTPVADRLNWKSFDDIYHLNGIRLASAVPTPCTVLALGLCVLRALNTRRRACSDGPSSSSSLP